MRHVNMSELRYPQLWKTCLGSWSPGLGPTGLSLYDWSNFRRHGTLMNMLPDTAWQVSDRRYSLKFDATNDAVVTPAVSLNEFSVSLWIYHATGNDLGDAISNRIGGGGGTTPGIIIGAAGVSGQWWYYLDNGSAYIARWAAPRTALFANNTWNHHRMTWSGSDLKVYLNGNDITASLSTVGGGFSGAINSTQSLILGARPALSGRTLAGSLDDVMLHGRILSDKEGKILASRRGIAYEPAPRRRSALVAGFNRRRRLLVGA